MTTMTSIQIYSTCSNIYDIFIHIHIPNITRFSVTFLLQISIGSRRHPSGTEPGDSAEGAALAGKHEGIHWQLASGVAWAERWARDAG